WTGNGSRVVRNEGYRPMYPSIEARHFKTVFSVLLLRFRQARMYKSVSLTFTLKETSPVSLTQWRYVFG
ncbi:hypothetical protein M1O18_05880, partial [Dehalococcoidia bacterium]|nr:hypothetical protein [Dehalococcoidia bacterium]